MSKSLVGRCIRRWKVAFKDTCDSKVSPHWRKRDLTGVIRESAIIMADSMVEEMAEGNAKVDFDESFQGWTPEFSEWYRQRKEKYMKEARDYLNEEADIDEIDEAITTDISYWE